MKKQLHIAIIILILGIFLMPTFNYACGIKSEKSCCNKEMSSKTESKDCCKNKKAAHQNKNCGGKCGHSNCTTISFSYPLLPLNEINFKINTFDFSTEEQNYFHSETFISSGFTSLWLLPKIS